MKKSKITKNYASILLVLFVIGLLLTDTLSTAYAAEYQTIADLKGKTIYSTGEGANPEYVLRAVRLPL